ncbi:hypothetical protein [Sandaracinus amylolyticus]|uniref:hypothetical protein n=1 Tax=Sandaracinus amylolyticus TaxID=927083 RepID=UPI001F31BE8C|nr:hypothetical protein [Sandaracinus amylolyticus]UJR81527.1 Hypothetical protein I5071_35870 [Sandaracinus amylolyticus]
MFAERDRFSSARVRPHRDAFINYWAALHELLVSKARLGTAFGDDGVRAQALLDAYFPEGVGFARLDAYAAWFEGQRRLDRMVEEYRLEEIGALAGAAMLTAVKKGTAALGEAIGVGRTARTEVPSATALQEALAKLSRAVGAYARLLAAKVDEEDAASIERFRRAVAPIDEYRAMRVKEGVVEEPVEPAIEPGASPTPASE